MYSSHHSRPANQTWFGIAVTLLLAVHASAQQGAGSSPAVVPPAPAASTTAVTASTANAARQKAQIQGQNQAQTQSQSQLLADTRRLYQLAAELKLELVNSSPDALSLSVVKKAAEVEKLAESLNQHLQK